MKIMLRLVAVLCVALAVFLIAASVNALASEFGARAGVVVAYLLGAILLFAAAVFLWKRPGRAESRGLG